MIKFKKIGAEDYKTIIPYLKRETYNICDYTTLGLFMWVDFFSYEYAIENDVLYIRGVSNLDGDSIEYMLPASKNGDGVFNYVKNIIEYERANGAKEVKFYTIPENRLPLFEPLDVKEIIPTRDWADYTYQASDLSELKGRKYGKKRNLIHQFESLYPSYSYEEITENNLEEVMVFHDKNGKLEETALAKYENAQVKSVLANYFEFSLSGLILRNNGEIIAFSIGEVVGDCLYVHVEKADREYKGVFQILNWLFVKTRRQENDNIRTVNRGEDVGDEGLKRSKTSYFPNLINKYRVVVKIDED